MKNEYMERIREHAKRKRLEFERYKRWSVDYQMNINQQ